MVFAGSRWLWMGFKSGRVGVVDCREEVGSF